MSESKLNSDELNIASRDVNHSEPQFNPNLMPEGGQFNVCPTCGGSGKDYDLDKHGLTFIPEVLPDCQICRGTGVETYCTYCTATAETHGFMSHWRKPPGIAKATSPVIDEAANDASREPTTEVDKANDSFETILRQTYIVVNGKKLWLEDVPKGNKVVAAILAAHREAVVRERVAELQHMKQAWGNDSTMDWEDWIDGRIAQLRKSSSSS